MKSSLKRHIPLLLIAGLLLGVTSACKTVKLKDAEEKQRLGEYYAAAAMYRKLYTKSKPTQRDLRAYIAYRMGYCNQRANNTGRATSAYLNAERYDYPDSLLPFHLGQVCQKEGRYDEAVKYYREYLAQAPTDLRAVRAIEGCDSAKSWREHPTLYQVARMERFNSRRSECCPMYYGDKYDQLYFNSTRGIVHKDSLNAITGLKNNAFFLVKKDENGAWQKPKEVDDPVASEYDQGTPSFSKDGNTMYYTYCAVDATDLSADALEVARINVAKHALAGRISLLQGDGLAACQGRPAYDLILCNPPYVNADSMAALPPEYRAEPHMALSGNQRGGRDGMDFIRPLLQEAAARMQPQAALVLEIGHEREHFEAAFPSLNPVWLPTSAGDDQVLLLTREALQAA